MHVPPPDTAAPFDPVRPLRLAAAAVRRAWPRMLGCFVAVMGLAAVGLYFAPREYGSDARLFVRVGRESVGLDPTASLGQTFTLNESRRTELNSVLDVITTRAVYERVAEKLGPDVILDQGGWSAADPVAGLFAAAAGGDGDDRELRRRAAVEKAVRILDKSFGVESEDDSSVIAVSCVADSPELAQRMMRSFLDGFREVYLDMHRSDGSYEFFEEQVALLRGRHGEAAGRLRDAKDAIRAASVDGRRAALQNQVEQTEDRILQAEAEQSSRAAGREELRDALGDVLRGEDASGAGTAGVAGGTADDAVDVLRKRVNELELQEQDYLTRFTGQHPRVVAVRERLAGARDMLARTRDPADPTAAATDPTFQGLHLRSLEERVDGRALESRLTVLREQLGDLHDQLRSLNAREAEIGVLQQQTDMLAAKYGEYSERLEQARLNRVLSDERITNVNVVQPPTFVLKPVSPRVGVVLAAAFALACGGAAALAFLSVPTAVPAAGEPVDRRHPDFRPAPRTARRPDGVRPARRPSPQFSNAPRDDDPPEIPPDAPDRYADDVPRGEPLVGGHPAAGNGADRFAGADPAVVAHGPGPLPR